ncbi:hypothetical protein ACFWJS_16705 [Streptomyces sp. NPDC127061]
MTPTSARPGPGGRGTWLVDQAVGLAGTKSPDGEAVRSALRRE